METEYNALSAIFQPLAEGVSPAAMSSSQEKLVEIRLNEEKSQIFFGYMASPNITMTFRIQAGIFIKNYILKHWEDEGTMSENTKTYIMENYGRLLKNCEYKIGVQLGEVARSLAKVNLRTSWSSFLPELIEGLSSQSRDTHQVVLITMKNLFRKYRYSFGTEQMIDEMIYVINLVGPQLFITMSKYLEVLNAALLNADLNALATSSQLLSLLLSIFYSLNAVDLPEFFEDNIDNFMKIFVQILHINSEHESILKLFSSVVKCVTLYTEKYSSNYTEYIPGFFDLIWAIAQKTTLESEYDGLVANVLKFFHSIIHQEGMGERLKQIMGSILTLLVYPNIVINDNDLDRFQNAPAEYFSADIEETDVETRRRNSLQLLRDLTRNLNMAEQVKEATEQEIQKYNSNPAENYLSKVNALNLLIGTHATEYTLLYGANNVKLSDVQMQAIFTNLIFPELENREANTLVISTSIKFAFVFRNQVPDHFIVPLISKFAELMGIGQVTISLFACAAVERYLNLKTPEYKWRVKKEELAPYLVNILQQICGYLEVNNSTYGIKGLFRLITVMEEGIIPYIPNIAQISPIYVRNTIKQSENPNYNYYLFEILGVIIKLGKDKGDIIRIIGENLMEPMYVIIEENKQELLPYAFQIFSLLVLYLPRIPDFHPVLVKSLLTNRGNWGSNMRYVIPAFVQYLRAGLMRILPETPISKEELTLYLDIFKQILELRMDDPAFALLTTIVLLQDLSDYESHMREVYIYIFTRMQKDKESGRSLSFGRGMLTLFSAYMRKQGLDSLKHITDAVQLDILWMSIKGEVHRLNTVLPLYSPLVISAYGGLVLHYAHVLDAQLTSAILEGLIELIALGGKRWMRDEDEGLHDESMQRLKFQQLAYARIIDIGIPSDLEVEKITLIKGIAELIKQLPGGMNSLGLKSVNEQKFREYAAVIGLQVQYEIKQ